MQSNILKTVPAEELFLMMSMKDDETEQAQTAFGEFYIRFAEYIRYVCETLCKSFTKNLNGETAEILYTNVLFLIYNSAGSFIVVEKEATERQKEKMIKGWIGKVAENELHKILRNTNHRDYDMAIKEESLPENLFEFDNAEDDTTSYEMELFEEAWAQLNKLQQDIVRYSYLYKESNKYTPHEIVVEMEKMFGLHRDNIRQIRHRSIEKLNNYINLQTNNYENDRRQHLNERRNL